MAHTLELRVVRLMTSLATACLLLGAALVLLAAVAGVGAPTSVLTQTGSGFVRVVTTGTDTPECGGAISLCRTIQYAVDLAEGGVSVLVAGGVYTGVLLHGGTTQLLFISKTLFSSHSR